MNMLKYKSYIASGTLYFALCTLFVGCSGDDLEQYAQHADNANEIGFMPRTEMLPVVLTVRIIHILQQWVRLVSMT